MASTDLLTIMLGSAIIGFIIAGITGIFLGRQKARMLMGGSLTAGIFFGSILVGSGVGPGVLGGVYGLMGWLTYCLLFPETHRNEPINNDPKEPS